MAWFVNSFGFEVWLDRDILRRIKERGHLSMFTPRAFKHVGTGPANKVCIIFASNNGSNGIGDYVHGMPALSQKVKDGYECHVFTTQFFRPFIEHCGAKYLDAGPLGIGSLYKLMEEYGEVHSLTHWCIEHDERTFGAPVTPRFQQLADFLGVTLPETFSWKECLIAPAPSV